jgi:hypothetical protein
LQTAADIPAPLTLDVLQDDRARENCHGALRNHAERGENQVASRKTAVANKKPPGGIVPHGR